MRVALLSFTTSGKKISKEIKVKLNKFYKYDNQLEIIEIDKNTFDDKLSNHMDSIFRSYDALIFISSTGIAVRLIAPYIKSKLTDPAVIVVDDLGKYTISLLSGHIGGANELSLDISKILNNQSIITTASDGRGVDAVDIFAKKNNLYIEDMEKAKKLTSLMVEGEKIKLISEIDLNINYRNIDTFILKDYEICNSFKLKRITSLLKDEKADRYKGSILVSSAQNIEESRETETPICILRPKVLNIGIGCRRGKSSEEILQFIKQIFKENNLSIKSVKAIGTIDIKHDEVGIIETSKQLDAEMVLFSKCEIEKVSSNFSKSEFVKSNVGVTSVCEPSAYLLGKEIVVSKKICNGITIAVSRSESDG